MAREKPKQQQVSANAKAVGGRVPAEHLAFPPEGGVVGAAVFAVSLGVYFRTAYPSVAGGDAGEIAVVSHELAVPHPPGYPTIAMLTWAAEQLCPGCPVGLTQNYFHAFLSSLSNTFLYFTAAVLTGSAPAGVLAAGLFGFAPIVWTYATHVEVFSLNNALITAVELLVVLWWHTRTHRMAVLGALMSGLALTNQHTSVLFVVPFCLWVSRHLPLSTVLSLGVWFAVGLLPYIYLPLSARLNPSANSWGDTATLDGFLTHFFRKEYGTFSLASKEATYRTANFTRTWRYYIADVHQQTLGMWLVALPVIAHSIVRGGVVLLFSASLLLYLNFFHYLCNLPIDKPLFYGVQQRFWLQPLTLLSVLVSCGVHAVCRRLLPNTKLCRAVLWCIALAVAGGQVALHFDEMDQSDNYAVRDYGRSILTPLPEGAIVLTKGDIMINSARYVQSIEGLRPDVRLVDQEMLTYEWYVSSLKKVYPDVRFPGDFYFPGKPRAFDIARFLAANKKRAVFLAHGFKDGDHSWQGKYSQVPFGVIHQVVPATPDRSLSALRSYLARTANDIPHPSNFSLPKAGKYGDHTWEVVVANDYWMAWHNKAFFLLDWHQKTFNPDKLDLQSAPYIAAVEARKIFSFLVQHNQPPGGISHRNLGVLLQGLSRYHPADIGIIRDMRNAFKEYLGIAQHIPPEQRAQIQQAVEHYTTVLNQIGS